MTHNWTLEQQAVISAIRNPNRGSILVSALAGSAKTTTIVAALQEFDAGYSPTVLCLAFNKRIAVELEKKLPKTITVKTMNALGHRAWGNYIGRRVNIDADKTWDFINQTWPTPKRDAEPKEHERTLDEKIAINCAVTWAKNYGWVPDNIANQYPYVKSFASFEAVANAVDLQLSIEVNEGDVREILRQSIEASFAGTIDFNDQIYMPCCFGGNWDKFDLVVVDEAQDLSALNHVMLRKSCKTNTGRLVAVGDDHQSIYGFRGAASGRMGMLQEQWSMEILPLTLCFRCKSNIILHVQKVVPEIRYWEENKGGAVIGASNPTLDWNPENAEEGSAIICRNNAPLMSVAFSLLRARRSFKLLGGDIGKGLINLCKKFPQDSFEGWAKGLKDWAHKESKKEKANKKRIQDKFESLMALAEDNPNPEEILRRLDIIFNSTSGSITLCTGHKSKGFEWEHVYFLDSHLLNLDDQQDRNLDYVIQTRAIDTLEYVNMSVKRKRNYEEE